MLNTEYDAVVVGSGPNGLSAAITMQKAGLSVLILESKANIGGGMRSAELTQPGFIHDVCSAIHPLAVESPFLRSLPLSRFGLEFIYPPVPVAHPFDDGTSACLSSSVFETANSLGVDCKAYLNLMEPLVRDWPVLATDILGPLRLPENPIKLFRFGLNAILPAVQLANRFHSKEARGLLSGMAAHSIQPLSNLTTSAIALVLMAVGHLRGWPVIKGGSQTLANALSSLFLSMGGQIETNMHVESMKQIPPAKIIMFDLTPRQLLNILGNTFSSLYRWQLKRYRYGMGVFKVDWALDGPIPFSSLTCQQAGTVHLGNTLEEISEAERRTSNGKYPDRPFVLLAQQSLFDPTRAPTGKQTAWAYCHVPNGSMVDRTDAIERQVERFAPGFRDRILTRHTMNTAQIESYNPNYIGGDINGGISDINQLFTRPVITLTPYKTSKRGIYICSSSTPPGGGVHGMCGYHAARQALNDIFGLKTSLIAALPEPYIVSI